MDDNVLIELNNWLTPERMERMMMESSAERSGGLQACPPSATGSADAGASDETGADSSGRSADKAVRALVQKWRDAAKLLRRIAAEDVEDGHYRFDVEQTLETAKAFESCARELQETIPALTAQRERACLPNSDYQTPVG